MVDEEGCLPKLKTYGPPHFSEDAEHSGFHCRECGSFWFGPPDATRCPDGHRSPVHVALLCRTCDLVVALDDLPAHLADELHGLDAKLGSR